MIEYKLTGGVDDEFDWKKNTQGAVMKHSCATACARSDSTAEREL